MLIRITNQKLIRDALNRLADLMYEHGIGVQTKATVQIKEIDSDFFEEL